jgi:vancomycin resistance protein YoaR
VKGQALQQEAIKKRRLIRTWWFWVLIAVGVLVALSLSAVLADWLSYYDKVHAGVSVYGVDLGGWTEDQAVAALTRRVDRAGPVILSSGDKTWSVTPDDVGRVMDVQGAVAEAMAVSRKGSFFEDVAMRFRLYRDPEDLPLDGTVDQAKLDAVLSRIATELHVTPQNARLAMHNGKVKVIEGLNGQDVDVAPVASQIVPLFVTLRTATLDIPLIVKEPDVQTVDNLAAQQQAEVMMSAPITLTNHDNTWTLSPEQIASWLDFRAEYENGIPTLIPYLAEGKMWRFLYELAPEVYRDPVNAKFRSDGGKVRVIPAIDGETLNATTTAQSLNAAAAGPGGRSIEVPVTITEPEFTTAAAEPDLRRSAVDVYHEVGRLLRTGKRRITTKYATDVFLAPGQEYNFDRRIGPRTEARGYELAPGIVGPNTLEDVLGGGICQVSTTMFNAVFFAGLKVTERHNHSIYINHYPKGRDATVTSGGKNLRFVNDTDHYIWIRGTSDGVTTTISIYGTSDGREVSYSVGAFYNIKSPTTVKVKDPTLPVGQTRLIDEGQTGRQLRTVRVVTLPDGTVIHRNTWISTWPMYPRQIAVGTKTTP